MFFIKLGKFLAMIFSNILLHYHSPFLLGLLLCICWYTWWKQLCYLSVRVEDCVLQPSSLFSNWLHLENTVWAAKSAAGSEQQAFYCPESHEVKVLLIRSSLGICFMYLLLAVVGLRCCIGFYLAVARGSYFLVVVHGLLITVASLIAEHAL